MMGAGKTTIGKLLAEKLDYSFFEMFWIGIFIFLKFDAHFKLR